MILKTELPSSINKLLLIYEGKIIILKQKKDEPAKESSCHK